MKAIEIRNKFLKFFEEHDHKIIPSAPLIPINDPSVLFTTAGMQPLVPYLLGEKHPEGNKLTDYQKCCRIWLMSLGATQPLKKRLRTSNPPATFGKPMAK